MKKYHLFEVFGIELEYMLVNKKSLKVASQVDELLSLKQGEITSDVENGEIAWSNELVAHVVELKTNGPTKDLAGLSEHFHENVVEINSLLEAKELQLLPTASHPLMNPTADTQLWKHSYSEVYALYNRIFNCKGHGWANVQSMHINLPFYDDEEFEKLHAAIRVLLPLLPALAASSPIFEGKQTGFKDSRMQVYKTNQKEIPVLAGKVIPERVFSKEAYHREIFKPINQAIQPYDTDKILEHHFLNSRGAIARFDRNAIEIRVLDLQECPKADVAIAMVMVEVLKWMISNLNLAQLKELHEDDLLIILNETILAAEEAKIDSIEFLEVFGLAEKSYTARQIWQFLVEKVKGNLNKETQETLQLILTSGSLSTRILNALKGDVSEENIFKVYRELAVCLQENKLFVN
ncbi:MULTISPECIES: glutamate-cysteine ligase family protein [Mesonia]|uniref:Glutamate--cysteine ligase n=1 Tax=Mesonia oceanica TaxID=2687242 RepID=A0AC61YE21_9FLAO|nr:MULTISPECIES: glutamate-cysteine ligase family protein [Mesonia]MAN29191.1 glutamate--cysteine ligase [Mesonia sp.]MAQ39985.1 glutamate--cysteine ligase [Mesonia sp.]MBJ99118.1 glutamate--cysteine ligase [Flavobacteriaceae bacterium]VVV01970.1 Glutamate--cysteine ligase [Mesonia oceanica]|tara:strand:- start:108552 stop:109772 length:1221 start_codon:yes stop_codon:yes gene_type:complete